MIKMNIMMTKQIRQKSLSVWIKENSFILPRYEYRLAFLRSIYFLSVTLLPPEPLRLYCFKEAKTLLVLLFVSDVVIEVLFCIEELALNSFALFNSCLISTTNLLMILRVLRVLISTTHQFTCFNRFHIMSP